MIGVVACESRRRVIREFFELFKTPWEFLRSGTAYDVIICSDSQCPTYSAQLVLIYGAAPCSFDLEHGIEVLAPRKTSVLSYQRDRIPIYGDCLAFADGGAPVLHNEEGETAALELAAAEGACVRLGFDLFAEVEELLRRGQPIRCARIATLDLHIALLRDLIVQHSIPLFEIPPIPAGYKFAVCLTHDVDHVGVKNHRFDHTMFGFLYRATIGSLVGFCQGRRSLHQLMANWKATLSLPFVHLGLAQDFWQPFDRYRELEDGAPSTYFIIPRKGDPGQKTEGRAPTRRAARYGIEEIRNQLQGLLAARSEIGLHGIDAWRDPVQGRAERETIRALGGDSEIGVRMHWLYFNEQSPSLLEEAGFSYDSTVGYNETVGYRAGTLQAFKPFEVDRLLELPLHVMDTALFFPTHMNASPEEAKVILNEMVRDAARFGGALTINWHDRSIAPERLWNQSYVELLAELKSEGAWFATATQAVAWFNKRRSAVVEQAAGGSIKVTLGQTDDEQPGLRLRLHNPQAVETNPSHGSEQDAQFSEVTLNGSKEMAIDWSNPGSMAQVA